MSNCNSIPHRPTPHNFCDNTLTIEELKLLMMDVFARFDTDPKLYSKWDYLTLLRVIKNLICKSGDGGDYEERFKKLEEVIKELQDETFWIKQGDADPVQVEKDVENNRYIFNIDIQDDSWNCLNP